MKGSKKFFGNIKSHEGVTNVYYDDVNQEGYMEYIKERNLHSSQITAFITSYQRMSVFEQMFEFEPEEIVRIHTDAIYATKTAEIKNVFRHQIKKMKKLQGTDKYISNIEKGLLSLAEAENRDEYIGLGEDDLDLEYHKGGGGCGKSYTNLTDNGFVRILSVAHSWKLARKMKEKYDCDVSVHARLLVSMLGENEVKKIIKNYSMCKIIFAGDVGFQLPAFNLKNGNKILTEEFMEFMCPIVKEYKTNYRVQDDKLLRLCNRVRDMMREEEHHLIITREIKRAVADNHIISIDDVKSLYKLEDMILCSVHKRKDKYTDMFKGKYEREKYYISNNNNNLYHKGEVIISDKKIKNAEVRHGYTIHAIQGEDAEHNLFIDLNKIYSREMIYTAISRARRLSQIYLVR
jgi:hypothetical protein